MSPRPDRSATARLVRVRGLAAWVRWNTPVLAAAGVVLVIVAAIVASSSARVARVCATSSVGCGIGENAAVVVLVALLAYVALIGRSRSGALRAYRRATIASPPVTTDGGVIKGTEAELAVVESALEDLAHLGSTNPIVIVGESGVGKSTALGLLKVRCALRGLVAFDIDLGRAIGDDLLQLAFDRFASVLAPFLRTSEQVNALWHYLLRASKLVCLVDGLEDFNAAFDPDLREQVIAAGANRAARAGLKVVLAARTFGEEPEGLRVSRLVLPALEEDAWRALLVEFGVDQRLIEGRLERLAHELRTPFVANLVRALPGDRIDAPEGQVQVIAQQVWLIGAYVEETVRAQSLPQALRQDGVSALAELAAVASLEGRTSLLLQAADADDAAGLARALARQDGIDLGVHAAVLGRTGAHGTLRFSHGLFQDYFASRAARDQPAMLELLVRRALVTHRYRLLAMAAFDARGAVDGSFLAHAEPLVRAVVTEAGPYGSLGLVRTWLGYRRAQGSTESWWQVARIAARLQARSTETERRAFIAEVALDPSPEATWLLWRFAHDQTFAIRWAAAVSLAARGDDALALLIRRFERIVASTEDAIRHEAVPTHYLSSGVVAWLLPSLVAQAAPSRRQHVTDLVDRISVLAERAPDPLWLEQSLARGYKMAAFGAHGDPARRVGGVQMLQRVPRFWYSRINLVQAIACDGGDERALALLEDLARSDPHPFVREAARQALLVARGTEQHRRQLWLVEAELLEHGFGRLHTEALVLLADVVLMLNLVFCKLNDSAIERSRSEMAKQWATTARLPVCLTHARRRAALFAGCGTRCDFGLCPYPLDASRGTARGEFTPSFCRAVESALRVSQDARPPWIEGSSSRLRAFWRSMEAASRLPTEGES